MTAHYNGYFNASELIRLSMESYVDSRNEDYYSLIPISPVPDETEVINLYPAIDTAIVKCRTVIQKHSMPNNDRPYLKKEEYNKWIDENWTMIGIASYLRRDYEGAMKSFKYVRKFYKNDPSIYIGELWMAKTNMATKKLTDAKFNLDALDKALEEQKLRNKGFGRIKNMFKKDPEEPAKFPKKILAEVEKTKAELALMNDNPDEAIANLEKALNFSRDSKEKARIHFVLGQLYEAKGDKINAARHYTKVIKGNCTYVMSFNARIKRAFIQSGDQKKKELYKMLKDAKNAEYQDQIYYALAEIDLKEGNETSAVENLTNSAFYSTTNTRQKGMAYEKLANLRMDKRDYVNAQKYYDSCSNVINDNYPNAVGIRNKAANLYKLVEAVETANYEDSVQRIALMDETARKKYLKELIKKIEEEEKRRKERDAERLRMLQENENIFADNGDGGKFYWNNEKSIRDGKLEFKRYWGERVDEDDWRRSEKIANEVVFDDGDDSDTMLVEQKDTLTVEMLESNLPLTEEAMAESNKKLLKAYFNAGVIYSDELNEDERAIEYFKKVLDRKIENKHNLLSAYQLYRIYKSKDASKASIYENYIMSNYPESDYAQFIKNPNYFIEQKEREALAEQEYVTMLGRYEKGMYTPVIMKADQVINEEKDNKFRVKYMLLKAYCLGMQNDDKQPLIPILESVILEYPDTEEANRAKEMIDIIRNGYSANVQFNFERNELFKYDEEAKLKVIILPPANYSSSDAGIKISNFNKQYFRLERLTLTSSSYTDKQGLIILSDFETEFKAKEYIRVYKSNNQLGELKGAQVLIITGDNLKILVEQRKLDEYLKFYDEYY